MADIISQHAQTLAKLGQPVKDWSVLLIHIVSPKLDRSSRREWEAERASVEEFPTLDEFVEFLVNRDVFVEALTRMNRNVVNSGEFRGVGRGNQGQGRSVSFMVSRKLACPICSDNHDGTLGCKVFLDMSSADRSDKVKKDVCVLNA